MKKAIYLLKDQQENVRYVGYAANPEDRYKRHLRECRYGNTHRKAWIRSMLDSGIKPIMEIVEWAEDWNLAERQWIFKMRALGHDLTNGNDGGFDNEQIRGKNSPEVKTPYYKKIVTRASTMSKAISQERLDKMRLAIAKLRASKNKWEKAGLADIFEFRMKLYYLEGFDALKEFDAQIQP
jgi:hypothetical protein